jgi:hypothetical protein
MMEVISKSCLKLLVATIFLMGCGFPASPVTHDYQAVVVLDKTNSVDYTGRLSHLEEDLKGKFSASYALATKYIQCSRLYITDNTSPFPEIDHFDKPYPVGDDRSAVLKQQLWQMAKKKWIYDELALADSLITVHCHANTTSVFPIFSGIQQIQHSKDPLDTTNVFIFSDMTNTCPPLNMLSGLSVAEAYTKGKSVCQGLISQGQVSADNVDKLFITIYAPNNVKNGEAVYQFWKGFFKQWGVPDSHYQFVQ